MNTGLRFQIGKAVDTLTCNRCLSLGLPANGIQPGESMVMILIGEKQAAYCCTDCFERLKEEVEPNNEGEEWKSK